MLRQIEGSKAVAEAVALCRPEVIAAYPISPQTHIVEALSAMVKEGTLSPCEYVNVESDSAAQNEGCELVGVRTLGEALDHLIAVHVQFGGEFRCSRGASESLRELGRRRTQTQMQFLEPAR